MNCRRAKKSFPDLLAGGPADAGAADHIRICGACAQELQTFRRVLDAASRYAEHDVPDPGEGYWGRLLPSVRARLTLRESPAVRAHSAPRAVAAVAAIMILAATGTLLLETPLLHVSDPLVAADQRLDAVFEKMPELLPQVAADVLGTDPAPDIDARLILEAIAEIDPPSGFVQDWSDEDMERMLDQLTRDQAARLRADLAAERG